MTKVTCKDICPIVRPDRKIENGNYNDGQPYRLAKYTIGRVTFAALENSDYPDTLRPVEKFPNTAMPRCGVARFSQDMVGHNSGASGGTVDCPHTNRRVWLTVSKNRSG